MELGRLDSTRVGEARGLRAGLSAEESRLLTIHSGEVSAGISTVGFVAMIASWNYTPTRGYIHQANPTIVKLFRVFDYIVKVSSADATVEMPAGKSLSLMCPLFVEQHTHTHYTRVTDVSIVC